MAVKTVIFGFLGCGGLATIAYLFMRGTNKKSDIINSVHKITQKIGMKKIDEIEKKQNIISSNIEESEEFSKETREKVKEIKREASKEILKTLSRDEIKTIDEGIDEKWDDI